MASLPVVDDGWLAGKNLSELELTEEGVLVLNIEREDGTVLGTPSSMMQLEGGDRILCYGKNQDLARLRHRRADRTGKIDHALAKRRQRLRIAEERIEDYRRAQAEDAEDQPDAAADPATEPNSAETDTGVMDTESVDAQAGDPKAVAPKAVDPGAGEPGSTGD